MKLRTILLSTLATVLSASTAHAAAGTPVTHSHDGRSHSHSLPATGKNHVHGKKPAPKAKTPAKTPKKYGWYNVADAGDSSVRFKYRTDKVVNGKIQGLFEWDEKSGTELYEYAVNVADCNTGYGALYRRNLGRDKFTVSSSGWVENGSSMGASIGSTLCMALDLNHK